MGKSTISMAIFDSYVSFPGGDLAGGMTWSIPNCGISMTFMCKNKQPTRYLYEWIHAGQNWMDRHISGISNLIRMKKDGAIISSDIVINNVMESNGIWASSDV